MNTEIDKNDKWNKILRWSMISVGIIGIIAIVVTLGTNFYYGQQIKRENLNLDQYIVAVSLEEAGVETNDKRDRFISIEESDDTKIINLILDMHSDKNTHLNLATIHTAKILEILNKDEEFLKSIKKISFRWWTPTVDNYGNIGRGLGLSITLDMETMNKINWDNITKDGFKNVSVFVVNRQLYPDYQ